MKHLYFKNCFLWLLYFTKLMTHNNLCVSWSWCSIICQLHNNFSCCYRYFDYLSVHGDCLRYDVTLAGLETRQCQDVLLQAPYHVARVCRMNEEDRQLWRKQEEEWEVFRLKQIDEQVWWANCKMLKYMCKVSRCRAVELVCKSSSPDSNSSIFKTSDCDSSIFKTFDSDSSIFKTSDCDFSIFKTSD
jgi:hypothetical protein